MLIGGYTENGYTVFTVEISKSNRYMLSYICIVSKRNGMHWTWRYIGIHGDTWWYMAIHGDTWRYMAIHGIMAISKRNPMCIFWGIYVCIMNLSCPRLNILLNIIFTCNKIIYTIWSEQILYSLTLNILLCCMYLVSTIARL